MDAIIIICPCDIEVAKSEKSLEESALRVEAIAAVREKRTSHILNNTMGIGRCKIDRWVKIDGNKRLCLTREVQNGIIFKCGFV